MNDNAEKLIKKYIDSTATVEENTMVEAGFLNDYKAGYLEIPNAEVELSCQKITVKINDYLLQNHYKKKIVLRRKLYVKIASIAATIIMAITLYYLTIQPQPIEYSLENLATAAESQPGGNGATITLSNGKIITLSDQQEGVQIGTNSLIYSDGSIIEAGSSIEGTKLTASTAKGQVYNFSLPDGTKVWLNAASEITIPHPFSGNRREVFLKGEAYFEVAKLKNRPFIVNSEDQTIEVLGTHFNVRAYPNLQKRTSLLEGKIKVASSKNQKYTVLNPGQEAIIENTKIVIQKTDVEASVFWVSGLFNFDGKSFQEIMQEVSDWYNLEVVYEGQIPKESFFGQVYKSDNLATVLRLLESAQLEYRVTNERKLIISNKERK